MNELLARIESQQDIVADHRIELEQAERAGLSDAQIYDFKRRLAWESGRLSGLNEAYEIAQGALL